MPFHRALAVNHLQPAVQHCGPTPGLSKVGLTIVHMVKKSMKEEYFSILPIFAQVQLN